MAFWEDSKKVHNKDVRVQIPITPTRALTIYKAQGQTLDHVFVRIKSLKEGKSKNYRHKFGLLYTAFTRVKEFLHLRISQYPDDLLLRTKITPTSI